MKQNYGLTNQIGYTCGIYCLVIADSIVNNTTIDLEAYYNIVQGCVDKSYTKIGEIFDINVFKKISDEFFPNITTEIYDIKSINEIKNKLKNNIIIMPVQYGDTPHYIVIYQQNSRFIKYYNYSIMNKFFNLKKIIKQNSSIVPAYIWKKKFLKKMSFSEIILRLILIIAGGRKFHYRNLYCKNILYRAIDNYVIKTNDIDNVNLKGKCILVSKK